MRLCCSLPAAICPLVAALLLQAKAKRIALGGGAFSAILGPNTRGMKGGVGLGVRSVGAGWGAGGKNNWKEKLGGENNFGQI